MTLWVDLCIQLACGMLAGQIAGSRLKYFSLGPDGDRFTGGIGGIAGAQILHAMGPLFANSAGVEVLARVAQVGASVGAGALFAAFFGALAGLSEYRHEP
jgi:hypothetical protein